MATTGTAMDHPDLQPWMQTSLDRNLIMYRGCTPNSEFHGTVVAGASETDKTFVLGQEEEGVGPQSHSPAISSQGKGRVTCLSGRGGLAVGRLVPTMTGL